MVYMPFFWRCLDKHVYIYMLRFEIILFQAIQRNQDLNRILKLSLSLSLTHSLETNKAYSQRKKMMSELNNILLNKAKQFLSSLFCL